MANKISLENFSMTMVTKQKVLFTNLEFLSALLNFLQQFEAVFGDADWPVTLCNLQNDAEYFIHPSGTFLEPGVEDEDNNWHNRGALLHFYRTLKHQIDMRQFVVTEIHPCGTVTKNRRQTPIESDDLT